MKDDFIQSKVDKLKYFVNEINELMSELQDMKVEVRISYIDPKQDIKQGITMWRCIEHNDYLENNE
jgi:hypothetical protein